MNITFTIYKLKCLTELTIMKKILFSFTVALGLFGSVNAQFPDGTLCPDFTGTDINGNTHNLYTYLDAGYTVVVDISATWCGPCWSYHQGGALEDLWMNHGPTGGTGVSASTTNDVIVLWVEGDGSTGLAELNGSGNTQGDWVTGTDFPIIDDASIAQTLNIAYYPTIYTIYPDRYLEESGQNGTTYGNISGNIANHTGSTGVDAGLFSYTGETVACGNLDVEVIVQNKGSQSLAAGDITVNVMSGGSTIGSATNSTTLAQWDTESVTIPVSLSSAATISIETVATGDVNTANNTLSQAIGFATPGHGDLTFELLLDNYASETTWEFKNSGGTTLESGGPYSAGDNNTMKTFTLAVPADDCYSVTILDSYGDGLGAAQWGGTDGSWTITDANGSTIASGSGDFGDVNTDKMDMTFSAVGLEESGINELSIYPNPINNIATVSFNVEGMERTSIEVFNTIGQNVQSIDLGVVSGNQLVKLNATDLSSGFYLINIKSGSKTVTTRVTVNK
jgi:hypothetical protein